MQHWIKSAAVSYKRKKNLFSLDDKTVAQSLVQSPCPFSKGEWEVEKKTKEMQSHQPVKWYAQW